MNFDAIWMVGMIEGAVPPALPPDPLLPEADWLSTLVGLHASKSTSHRNVGTISRQ